MASSVGRAHCLPVAAAGAMEPALKGPLYIQNIANGQAIDLSGGTIADDQPISEWKPNSSAPQQWWFEKAGSGWHLKSNINGEYCLARRDDDSSAPTLLRKCAATGEWEVLSLGDGQYLLKVPGKELFLNVADETFQEGRALVVSANRGPGAQWSLIDVGFRAGGSAGCDDPTLDEVTFLGTHNAFHSSAYGSKLLPNQTTSVAQQLADGVRGFQLDVYDHDATVWTCHGSCDIDGLRGPPFKDLLQDAVDFLNRNPNEIVTLFLEDHVAKADDLCKVLDAVPGLKALVFDPNQYDVLHKGWPRLSTLRARNHRLLFLSQQSGRESCGVMYDRRFESENYWSLGAITATPDLSCRTRWAGAPLNACGRGGAFRPLHVMNHYRDAMFSLNCAGDNGARLRQRALEICAQAAGRKPNFIVVDCYEVGDAKKVVDELNRCDPNACRCP